MTYQDLADQVFALPASQREAAAAALLRAYTEDDKDLVALYIYEAITAADDRRTVILL